MPRKNGGKMGASHLWPMNRALPHCPPALLPLPMGLKRDSGAWALQIPGTPEDLPPLPVKLDLPLPAPRPRSGSPADGQVSLLGSLQAIGAIEGKAQQTALKTKPIQLLPALACGPEDALEGAVGMPAGGQPPGFAKQGEWERT